jgi:hypothetical protein
MFSFKRFLAIFAAAIFAVSAVFAQSNTGKEMTVEESYLQEAIELMIIRETARADTREQTLIALEYIGDAISRGNTNDEIRQTLAYLANEGTRSVARENNRVVNNFPDVRRQAAKYLGQVGTAEAKDSLLDIIKRENEPAVLQEAIKSLGDIGLNENNQTIDTIEYIFMRFHNTKPDNLMALATIDAIEKLYRANKDGITSPDAIDRKSVV